MNTKSLKTAKLSDEELEKIVGGSTTQFSGAIVPNLFGKIKDIIRHFN